MQHCLRDPHPGDPDKVAHEPRRQIILTKLANNLGFSFASLRFIRRENHPDWVYLAEFRVLFHKPEQ